MEDNLDQPTVDAFGEEWQRFDYQAVPDHAIEGAFQQYFEIFPWHQLPGSAIGFDIGCGSGRWANFVAPRVGHLHCIDASEAVLGVARRKLTRHRNCSFHHASVSHMPIADDTMDFGYSLGVLHHVPDTAAALRSCVRKLKVGAPFLVYLYYDLVECQPWFRWLWQASDRVRRLVCALPSRLRQATTDCLAAMVYFPLARLAWCLEKCGVRVEALPLSYYRNLPFYVMRNDALDRFGTRLEQRFNRAQITAMMCQAGLSRIQFREGPPRWCALGYRST
jgi:SAM-dependent methyltransferase